jgi:hypothetical protein
LNQRRGLQQERRKLLADVFHSRRHDDDAAEPHRIDEHPLVVKALNGEILLKSLGSGAAQCSSMTLAPLTLPAGGQHDPTNASDSEYLGTMPTVTAARRWLR